MESNQLYTFKELIEQGGEESKPLRIIIPKIQRAYAQGRKEEKQVRDSILEDMFEAMKNEKDTEFSFVYGSVNNDRGDFELLDGQQRMTTLFLLHVYAYLREESSIPLWLKGCFVYETRTSSSDFIKKLVDLESIADNACAPSKIIKRKLWFTNAYKLDSTVTAMLTMLDSIHDIYNQYGIQLVDKLCHLKFYRLPLEKFGLSEELYIKMNARGLSLTPFENFKADLVGYYRTDPKKCSKEELSDWLGFATSLDTKWIDIFWNKEDSSDKDFNDKFFRFFYRYCAIQTFLNYESQKDAKSFSGDKDDTLTFFEQISEKQSEMGHRYEGFKYYRTLLDNKIDIKGDASKILDLFYHKKETIFGQLESQWEERCDLFGENNTFTRQNRIVFAAIIMFITNYEQFDERNYKRWMRIVWNVVENTNIDGVVPQINTTRNLNSILKSDSNNQNIYLTLKEKYLENAPQAIVEEARKANLIVNNCSSENCWDSEKEEEWVSVFCSLERHPFFKGFIDTIITDNIEIDGLRKRVERIKGLFDKEGISQEYRNKHLLVRALVASINRWNGGLNGLSITEKVDSDAHLKALLRRENIKTMFVEMLDGSEDIETFLKNFINAIRFDHSEDGDIPGYRLDRAYERLCNDVSLYNWISEHSNSSKCVLVKERDLRIKVRVPRNWYDKIYIDNERRKIIPNIVKQYGFYYNDINQQSCFNVIGDYWGENVYISKDICTFRIDVCFTYLDEVKIYLANMQPNQLSIAQSIWENINQLENDTVSVLVCSLSEASNVLENILKDCEKLK